MLLLSYTDYMDDNGIQEEGDNYTMHTAYAETTATITVSIGSPEAQALQRAYDEGLLVDPSPMFNDIRRTWMQVASVEECYSDGLVEFGLITPNG